MAHLSQVGDVVRVVDNRDRVVAEFHERSGDSDDVNLPNPFDYGADGNDSADDTVKMRKWLLDSARWGAVYLPGGFTFGVFGALDFPLSPGIRVVGDGKLRSIIKSYADNEPILRANCPGANLNAVVLEDFGLQYATQRSSAKTDAFGLQFKGGTPGAGYFDWVVRNLEIKRAFMPIGIGGSGTGAVIWGSEFTGCSLIDCTGGGFKLWSYVGSPRMLFRNNIVWNQTPGMNPVGAALSGSPMFAHIDGLEVLGWNNQKFLEFSGVGIPVLLENFNAEACNWDNGSTVNLFQTSGGFKARQVSIQGAASAGTQVKVIHGGSSGGVDVKGLQLDIGLSGGALSYPFAQCHDLRYKDVNLVQAVTFQYYDNESQGAARRNSCPTPYVKAGAPVDADFTDPYDGLKAYDSITGREYTRLGGVWKYSALT